jgi:hypothetical protein
MKYASNEDYMRQSEDLADSCVKSLAAQVGILSDALPEAYRPGEESSVRRTVYEHYGMKADPSDCSRIVAADGSMEQKIQRKIDDLSMEMIKRTEDVIRNLSTDPDPGVNADGVRASIPNSIRSYCGSESTGKPKWAESRDGVSQRFVSRVEKANQFLTELGIDTPELKRRAEPIDPQTEIISVFLPRSGTNRSQRSSARTYTMEPSIPPGAPKPRSEKTTSKRSASGTRVTNSESKPAQNRTRSSSAARRNASSVSWPSFVSSDHSENPW